MGGGWPRYGRGRLSYGDEQLRQGDHSLPGGLPGGVQDPFLCDLLGEIHACPLQHCGCCALMAHLPPGLRGGASTPHTVLLEGCRATGPVAGAGSAQQRRAGWVACSTAASRCCSWPWPQPRHCHGCRGVWPREEISRTTVRAPPRVQMRTTVSSGTASAGGGGSRCARGRSTTAPLRAVAGAAHLVGCGRRAGARRPCRACRLRAPVTGLTRGGPGLGRVQKPGGELVNRNLAGASLSLNHWWDSVAA